MRDRTDNLRLRHLLINSRASYCIRVAYTTGSFTRNAQRYDIRGSFINNERYILHERTLKHKIEKYKMEKTLSKISEAQSHYDCKMDRGEVQLAGDKINL